MLRRGILALGLAVLFLMGSTFTFASFAGGDVLSGILPSNVEASFNNAGFDLDTDDWDGPDGDPSHISGHSDSTAFSAT